MNDSRGMPETMPKTSNSTIPAWRLIFAKELHDLWIGGKALILLLLYTVMLSVTTFVMATNSELSLIPANEMVNETLKDAMAVALLIGLIIGADSLSGERERATLETLLLTPISRRQLVVGKFLAALSPWPAALVVTLPYLAVLSQGDRVLGPAIIYGTLLGTVLAVAYTALGVVISFICNSNRASFFISLGIYITLLVPSQLPGSVQAGPMGQFLQWINPLQAVDNFLEKILINNRQLDERWHWLTTPVLFAAITLVLAFVILGPALRLEGGKAIRRVRRSMTRVAGFILGVLLIGNLLVPAAVPVRAFGGGESDAPQPRLSISVNLDYKEARAGEHFGFTTDVNNMDTEPSSALIVAMNIINLDAEGEVVDPEDWSPQRTQYIESLDPGEKASLSWEIAAILDGDYMVYMVLIPSPEKPTETTHPVASPGIHLTVTPFSRLNPGGVLPFVIGGPLAMLALTYFVYRKRNRGREGA